MAHKKRCVLLTVRIKRLTTQNFFKNERKEKTTKTIIPLFDEKKKTT